MLIIKKYAQCKYALSVFHLYIFSSSSFLPLLLSFQRIFIHSLYLITVYLSHIFLPCISNLSNMEWHLWSMHHIHSIVSSFIYSAHIANQPPSSSLSSYMIDWVNFLFSSIGLLGCVYSCYLVAAFFSLLYVSSLFCFIKREQQKKKHRLFAAAFILRLIFSALIV